jgi:hypothetical protein
MHVPILGPDPCNNKTVSEQSTLTDVYLVAKACYICMHKVDCVNFHFFAR